MKSLHLLSLASVLLLGACRSSPEVSATPRRLTPAAARQLAHRDFDAGQPKIYCAGGIAVFEPGITESQKPLVAALPRDSSLAGCTNPKVGYSIGFATAYNQEIVSLLQRRDGR